MEWEGQKKPSNAELNGEQTSIKLERATQLQEGKNGKEAGKQESKG